MNDNILNDLCNHTDLNPWYWLSYGEKCYAFAVVEAYPEKMDQPFPTPGSELIPDNGNPGAWVGENGVAMIIDTRIADIEQQNGGVICKFIAAAHYHFIKTQYPEFPKILLRKEE